MTALGTPSTAEEPVAVDALRKRPVFPPSPRQFGIVEEVNVPVVRKLDLQEHAAVRDFAGDPIEVHEHFQHRQRRILRVTFCGSLPSRTG